jgi:TonB family protein
LNEAVDRLIVERRALDRGFPGGMMISVVVHVGLLAAAIVVPMLMPKPPLIRVALGFAQPLPAGGHGSPTAVGDPAPAPPQPKPEPPKPEPEPPKPKREIIKPPKEEKKTGLPMPDAKKGRAPKETPTPARAGGMPGGTGTSSQTPGVEFAPVGPGIPSGTDPNGDWYMAGVQRKIWLIWTRQIKTGMGQPIIIRFTILSDGSVEDVQIQQTSGVYLLDAAAQRAVVTAAPFSPLPKHYGTDRVTIQANFRPTD